MAETQKDECFIVQGQIASVAEVGEDFRTQYDRRDGRLRVIYDSGTESNLPRQMFFWHSLPSRDLEDSENNTLHPSW